MRIADFRVGTPYSSWLKENLLGELHDNPVFRKKYNIVYDDELKYFILEIAKGIEDYPENLQKASEELIRSRLDKSFKL